MYEKIGISKRLQVAILKRGAGSNIIKNLAELIKNSDDSYDELQQSGIDTLGIIEVGFWKQLKNKRSSINAFSVRDYGVGMSPEEAKNAFGSKSYGEDTSKNRRNGAIGVGGKDALVGMLDVDIITIKDRIPTLIHIKTDDDGLLESEIIEEKEIVVKAMGIINGQIKKSVGTLNLDQNGTFTRFRLPETRNGLKFDNLRDSLKEYYTLRNITNGKNKTKLKLINMDSGDAFNLLTTEPESEIIQKLEPIQIPYQNETGIEYYQVDIIIKRAKEDLEHEHDTGTNFSIETEQGGILDNWMFGFERDPAASKIFGNIIINKWKSLFRQDQGLLPENREGLLWSHTFNKQIDSRIRQYLKPIIDQERRKLGSNPEADKKLTDKMKTTLSFLNKLMKENVFEDEPDVLTPPEIMEFSNSKIQIVPGKTRSVKLLINPLEIPESSEIQTVLVEGEKSGCSVDPIGIVKTSDQYHFPPTIPFINFEISGNDEGSESHLKAYFQKNESEVIISVVPETELYPKDGFAFYPSSVKLIKKVAKTLKLRIDTHIFPPGTTIELHSEDERIILPFSKITVSQPNIGRYLSEELITGIKCDVPKIQTQITAKICNNRNEERIAICKIKVVEKEEAKVFFKDITLDQSGDPRERARFNEGTIFVHVHHPVLELYFGRNQEKITQNPSKEAVTLLADTVLNISLRQMAIKRIEDGIVDILEENRKDEEIELERKNLERKYGKQIHQHLTATYEIKN